MNFYSKIVVTIALLCAVVNPAKADRYEKDAQGRFYRVCDGLNRYNGYKFLELTDPGLADPVHGMTFVFNSLKDRNYSVDVDNATAADRTKIHLWTTNNGASQQFTLKDAGDGYFFIILAKTYGTDKMYAVDGGGTAVSEGNIVHLYSYGSTNTNQMWKFDKHSSDGSYKITCKASGKVLDITGGTMATDTQMETWTDNGSAAQRWDLRPVIGGSVLTRAIPDTYFQNYLVRNFPVYKYNVYDNTLVGGENPVRATPSSSNTSYPTCGANERLVILPIDYAEAITEFNNLGKYGNISYKDQSTLTKQFEGASNFKGVEYFTKLKKLDLTHAQFGDSIGSADSNPPVAGYHANYTKIKPANLDLRYNTELEYLNLDYADFKSSSDLQSSHIYDLKKLKFLNLSNNFLTEIDLDQFPVLERFEACHNFDLRTIKANIENRNMKELAIFDSMFGYKDGDEDTGALQALIDKFPNLVFLHAFATPNYNLDLTGHEYLESIWLLKSAYGASQGLVYDGTYNIVSYKDPNLGLDCANSGTGGGTNVGLYTLDKSKANQKFKIVYRKTENSVRWYSILPSYATNMSLDVNGGYSADGTNIQLWVDDQNNSKLFAFVRNDDGTYKIVSKLNGTSVLDIKDGNIASGTNIQLWSDNGSAAQKWVLLPVNLTISNGQSGNARQIGKGPWLHKLDLSRCKNLRDVQVQNMHLASLNLNSEYIKQPLSDEYKDWTFCREVTNSSLVYGAGKLVPGINVNNNYRHVDVIPYKQKQYDGEKEMWYWMFYLRLTYNENGKSEKERSLVLDNQTSYFETLTLDGYGTYETLGSMSRKTFDIKNTLGDDLFDGHRVTGCYKAKEIDNINSTGLMAHNKPDKDQPDTFMPMCTIEHDGTNEPVVNYGTADAGTRAFLDNFHKKVNGRIVVLKAGVSDTEPFKVPDDVPKTIMYTYNMNHYSGNQNAAPARRGVSVKENTDPIVGMFYFDLHYPVAFNSPGVVTGIEESVLETNKEVASVKYYNVAGQESVVPFRGINIVKVTYTDGTSTASKVIK